MKRNRLTTCVCVTIITAVLSLCVCPLSAAILQIDTGSSGGDTLTGTVGTTSVSITTSRTTPNWIINDDVTSYTSGLYGSLAQTAGTIGDFCGEGVREGDIFTWQIKLGGPLLDPIIYVGDIDAVGATVTYPSGGDVFYVSPDGSRSGDVVTALQGAPTPGAYGAFSAVQYSGLFTEDYIFTLEFDFDTGSFSAENVGLGLAATEVDTGGPIPIPVPSSILLVATGLAALTGARRKRGLEI